MAVQRVVGVLEGVWEAKGWTVSCQVCWVVVLCLVSFRFVSFGCFCGWWLVVGIYRIQSAFFLFLFPFSFFFPSFVCMRGASFPVLFAGLFVHYGKRMRDEG